MQIKYKGGDKFEIKSKDVDVVFAGGVSINGFAFPGPGEYEKAGVILNGISDGNNTIYVAKIEEMNLGYLNKISHDLTEDETKAIGDIDILIIPLGEEGTTDIKTALKIISKIDPRVVIPMLYDGDLAEFKKSEGITDGETDSLKIRKADLPEEERQIAILKSS